MSVPSVTELLHHLDSSQARLKLAASKALRDLSARSPGRVYPHFDVFAGLLGHDHSILRWNAILTLAYLAPADHEGRLDHLLDAYLAPMRGPVMITAANTIKGAALIARARPHLAPRIVAALLGVSKASYLTPECRNVAIGHALTAFAQIAPALDDLRPVRAFARRQRGNPRPATAAKAKRLAEMPRESAARGWS
jgi:hypothetical protein